MGENVSNGGDSPGDTNRQKVLAEREQPPTGSAHIRSQFDGLERVISVHVIPALSMVTVVSTAAEEALKDVIERANGSMAIATLVTALLLLLALALSIAYVRHIAHTQLLSDSEARYRGTFNQAAVGIAHTALDGHLIRSNDRLASMLGFSVESLEKRLEGCVDDLTHPQDRAVFRNLCLDLFLNPELSGQSVVEMRLLHQSGDVVWVSVTTNIAFKHDGRPDYFISVVQNITAQRKAQQEIERLNHELEQRVEARTTELKEANQRLESFSYSVSHDLRNPLVVIAGFSALLKRLDSVKVDERAQLLLDRINAGVNQMYAMIDGLLTLATLARGEINREPVDLTACAQLLLTQTAEADPARTVKVSIQDSMVVQADVRLLNSLLGNLIGNAWKFTSKTEGACIEVGCLPGLDGQEVVYVRDNGAGFDMAQAPKLFGVFERLHSTAQFQGTGIGLATVKKIVDMHKGRIWVQAVPERGATFFFTLGTQTLDVLS